MTNTIVRAEATKKALFRDRRDAGKKLAQKLIDYASREDVIILALPRGGVPVAYEVSVALHVPLDIFIVRKLGWPGHEEMAIGAIASGGVKVLNEDIVRYLNIPDDLITAVAQRELRELERRERVYRGNRPALEVKDRTVMIIDDGLATGASMRAALLGVRGHSPAAIVVAVPTSALETCEALEAEVDRIICASTPEPFYGVSRWYEDFSQITDEEVRILLQNASRQPQHK